MSSIKRLTVILYYDSNFFKTEETDDEEENYDEEDISGVVAHLNESARHVLRHKKNWKSLQFLSDFFDREIEYPLDQKLVVESPNCSSDVDEQDWRIFSRIKTLPRRTADRIYKDLVLLFDTEECIKYIIKLDNFRNCQTTTTNIESARNCADILDTCRAIRELNEDGESDYDEASCKSSEEEEDVIIL
jgi:hypothetical protein